MSINMEDRGGIITNQASWINKTTKAINAAMSRPHNRGMDAPVIKAAPWY